MEPPRQQYNGVYGVSGRVQGCLLCYDLYREKLWNTLLTNRTTICWNPVSIYFRVEYCYLFSLNYLMEIFNRDDAHTDVCIVVCDNVLLSNLRKNIGNATLWIAIDLFVRFWHSKIEEKKICFRRVFCRVKCIFYVFDIVIEEFFIQFS